jgi:hypothetical protein
MSQRITSKRSGKHTAVVSDPPRAPVASPFRAYAGTATGDFRTFANFAIILSVGTRRCGLNYGLTRRLHRHACQPLPSNALASISATSAPSNPRCVSPELTVSKRCATHAMAIFRSQNEPVYLFSPHAGRRYHDHVVALYFRHALAGRARLLRSMVAASTISSQNWHSLSPGRAAIKSASS